MKKIPAIICDLDGTLYNAKIRQDKFLRAGEKKDFDSFHKAAKDDQPHFWCVQLIQAMRNHGFHIIFTSGRDDTFRNETVEWLKQHLNWKWRTNDYELIMRPAGDYTADDDMKLNWFKRLIEPKYEVLFAIDDRRRVVDMWRGEGVTCLHCDEGNF